METLARLQLGRGLLFSEGHPIGAREEGTSLLRIRHYPSLNGGPRKCRQLPTPYY